jgi:DNA polymerase-3 subunit epsilon
MLPSSYSTKESATSRAKEWVHQKPVYLDTETTGVSRSDEIIEISILESDGTLLFESFIKPMRSIPLEAQRIHGISNEIVSSSPAWPFLWPQIRSLLYGRPIAAYNSPFDLRMMKQSYENYGLRWKDSFLDFDIMVLYSDFQGVWDPIRESMKFFKLEEARQYFEIQFPNAHRSTADALLTRAVLHSIASEPY